MKRKSNICITGKRQRALQHKTQGEAFIERFLF